MIVADDEHFHPAQTLFPAVHVAVHPPPLVVHSTQESPHASTAALSEQGLAHLTVSHDSGGESSEKTNTGCLR